jgi:Na+/melibiose symporter-like transporter
MSMWLLYLLVKLDSLSAMFGWVLVLIIVSSLISVPCYMFMKDYIYGEEEYLAFNSKYKKFLLRIMLPLFILFTLIFTMLPTTKEFAFIYIVGKLSQNKQIQNIGENAINIPDNALEILNLKMNEYVVEMKKDIVKQSAEVVDEVKK